MNHLKKLIYLWKSLYKDFLMGNGIQECVAPPHKKLVDALGNKTMNANRQTWLKKVRAVIKAATTTPSPTNTDQGAPSEDASEAMGGNAPRAQDEETIQPGTADEICTHIEATTAAQDIRANIDAGHDQDKSIHPQIIQKPK
jgi:hypothetical protein